MRFAILHKLLLLALAPLLIGGSTLLVHEFLVHRDSLLQEVDRRVRVELALHSAQLRGSLDRDLAILRTLAASDQARSGRLAPIVSKLNEWPPLLPEAEALYYFTLDGTVYDAAGGSFNVRDRDYFPAFLRGETIVRSIPESRGGTHAIVLMLLPARDAAGRQTGGLGAAVNSSRVVAWVSGIRVGETGFAMLAGDSGIAFADSRSGAGPSDLAALNDALRRHLPSPFPLRIRGEACRVYYQRPGPAAWTLLLVSKVAETDAMVRSLAVNIALVLALIAALGVVVALALRRVLGRPIRTLIEMHRRVADGETGVRAPDTGNDELGDLASSFNGMAAALESADARRRESEALFRTQFEYGNTGAAIIAPDQRAVRVNRRCCEMFRSPEEKLLGRKWQEITDTGSLPSELAKFNRMLAGEIEGYESDCRFIRDDGTPLDAHLTIACTRDDAGQVRIVIALIQDLTERTRAEASLRASENAQRVLIANIPGAVYRCQAEWPWMVVEISHEIANITGIPPAGFLSGQVTLGALIDAEDTDEVRRRREQAVAAMESYELVYRVTHHDGSRRWVQERGRAVQDAEGEGVWLAGVILDVTERHATCDALARTQAELAESEARFRAAFDNLPFDFWFMDAQGVYRLQNKTAIEHWGSVVGKRLADLTVPDAMREYIENNNRKALSGHVVTREVPAYVSGGERHLHEIVCPVWDRSRVIGALGICVDITERKRTEEALRSSTERLLRAQKLGRMGDFELDPRTGQMTWSDEVFSILDATGTGIEPTLQDFLLFAHPGERQRLARSIAEAVSQAGAREQQYKIVRRCGEERHIRMTLEPRTESGADVRIAGTIQDVTDQQVLRAQFEQAQKMEAVGRLAGGVAHDFNNLLTIIGGYSLIVLESLRAEDPLHEQVSEIHKAAQRAASLTHQLLAFSRKQVLAPRVTCLNSVIAESGKMLRRLIGEDVQLETDLDYGLDHVLVDPGQIVQVVMNLAVNARDAMPDGGRLTIETKALTLDEDRARELGLRAGPYAALRVSDSGSGMPEDVQAHIFEPFFTTKPSGRGTGLGLSTVYGIVEQSSGVIRVSSRLGEGTMFEILLPAAAETARREAVVESRPAPGGSERVLLVEDDPSLRALARSVLAGAGYSVLDAATGTEAMDSAREHAGRLQLLVTDIVLPGANGREVAAEVRRTCPDAAVLFMSGYAEVDGLEQDLVRGRAVFLPKPFTPDTLLREARRALASERRETKILIVVRDPAIARMMSSVVSKDGHVPFIANSISDAVDTLSQERFDVVVVGGELSEERAGVLRQAAAANGGPAWITIGEACAADACLLPAASLPLPGDVPRLGEAIRRIVAQRLAVA